MTPTIEISEIWIMADLHIATPNGIRRNIVRQVREWGLTTPPRALVATLYRLWERSRTLEGNEAYKKTMRGDVAIDGQPFMWAILKYASEPGQGLIGLLNRACAAREERSWPLSHSVAWYAWASKGRNVIRRWLDDDDQNRKLALLPRALARQIRDRAATYDGYVTSVMYLDPPAFAYIGEVVPLVHDHTNTSGFWARRWAWYVDGVRYSPEQIAHTELRERLIAGVTSYGSFVNALQDLCAYTGDEIAAIARGERPFPGVAEIEERYLLRAFAYGAPSQPSSR